MLNKGDYNSFFISFQITKHNHLILKLSPFCRHSAGFKIRIDKVQGFRNLEF